VFIRPAFVWRVVNFAEFGPPSPPQPLLGWSLCLPDFDLDRGHLLSNLTVEGERIDWLSH